MRNIDKKCAIALYESSNFKGGNTVVTSGWQNHKYATSNHGMYLHGNQIVRITTEVILKIQHWFNSICAVGILQQLERESTEC